MSTHGTVLVVDDDPLVLEALRQMFCDDYSVLQAQSGNEALKLIAQCRDIDAVVVDIKMAEMDGLELASRIQQKCPDLPIIFNTGYPGDYSEEEIDKGYHPFDYVGKNERPIRLQRAVKNAVSQQRLRASGSTLAEMARSEYGIVGKSNVMLKVYQVIEKIGPTDTKVMILGPTGTGKELVARALHKRSCRACKTLVPFNCHQRNQDLVASELFGHLKGSFTGAMADAKGVFEFADGGTVFLDEIGDLDINTQAKILRVLEYGEYQRVGSPEIIKVNVRLICATNHDLARLVEQGVFRQDLYYRLKGVVIELPALRERREDIPLLIDHFAERYAWENSQEPKIFDRAARDFLIEYEWPGNVRQLMDTVQSLIELTPSYYISLQNVMKFLAEKEALGNGSGTYSEQVRDFKRRLILKSLDKNGNNVSAAARELMLDPSNLHKLIKELEINKG